MELRQSMAGRESSILRGCCLQARARRNLAQAQPDHLKLPRIHPVQTACYDGGLSPETTNQLRRRCHANIGKDLTFLYALINCVCFHWMSERDVDLENQRRSSALQEQR